MTIAEARASCKAALAKIPRRYLAAALAGLALLFAFLLGYLAGRGAAPGEVQVIEAPLSAASGEVVASRSGSKYYLPWCAGAARINPENRITFSSGEEAQGQGYAPSTSCKGL